jgi:hypothetical protein
MMQYNFYVLTDQGLKNAVVTSDSNFDCAPFGFVPYRVVSTCTCEPQVIEDFWNCVDSVLQKNKLTPANYVRAVRAYTDQGDLCGEFDPNQ